MNLTLVREISNEQCSCGVLTAGELQLQTLELPFVASPQPGGAPFLSCVPAGEYRLETHDSPKHPYTWALVNPVLGVYHSEQPLPLIARYDILLHVGNFVDQLQGCIALGQRRQHDEKEGYWVSLSAMAMSALHKVMPWNNSHTLTISYATGVKP